jgi:hypothetical protein
MEDEKKPIIWMVLFGIARHVLGIVGTWLATRGLIDADTHARIVSEGATELVGYLLMLVPIVWSVMQKLQVMKWLKTALHLDDDTTTVNEIPTKAPGSSMPL